MEELSTLQMVAIIRADLPLTPAATRLLDLLGRGQVLRTSTRNPKKAAWRRAAPDQPRARRQLGARPPQRTSIEGIPWLP